MLKYTALLPFKVFFHGVFRFFFKHFVSPVLPVVCDYFPACLHLLLSLGIAQQSSLEASLVSFWKNVFDSKLQCEQGFADFIYAEPYF